MKFILASGSPRRRELLTMAGYEFDIEPADIDETRAAGELPEAFAQRMAREKAEAVVARAPRELPVLASDTIVVLHGDVLGKPRDAQDAAAMLRRLSGQVHEVITAVAIMLPDGQLKLTQNCTKVTFSELDPRWIEACCATEEPLDKAGAYAIQGMASTWISRIEGSYTGVMGLPLYETARLLDWAEARLAGSPGATLA